jgi:hypothetical protein
MDVGLGKVMRTDKRRRKYTARVQIVPYFESYRVFPNQYFAKWTKNYY